MFIVEVHFLSQLGNTGTPDSNNLNQASVVEELNLELHEQVRRKNFS